MTPLEAGALLFTSLTAAVALYALKGWRSGRSSREWPYSVLGVSPDSSLEAVKRAYRELVKRYHPDRLPPNTPLRLRKIYEEQIMRLNTAYKTILALHDSSAQSLSIKEEDFSGVEETLSRAEAAARAGASPKEVLELCLQAAEELVSTLCKASRLVVIGKNYYDLLTDLMIKDLITTDEFNFLVEIKKLKSKADRVSQSPRDVLKVVRRLNGIYLKIRERYLIKGGWLRGLLSALSFLHIMRRKISRG